MNWTRFLACLDAASRHILAGRATRAEGSSPEIQYRQGNSQSFSHRTKNIFLGTRMLVKPSRPVAVPRMPHLGAGFDDSKPGRSGVTRKAVIFVSFGFWESGQGCAPSPSTPAIAALVMLRFSPLRI